jgi:ribosomal protein S18 acetylase RimI-like enzyme
VSVPRYTIRRAVAADVEPIMALLDEAIAWLGELGLDQWQDNRERQRTHVLTDLSADTVYVVEREGRVVATITLDEFADADFWCVDDKPAAALYVHRMAVARSDRGVGLGSAMLDWAADQAEAAARTLLRLDAWQTNEALHLYYKNLGFEMVRIEPVEHRGSGALFARPASDRHDSGPTLVDLRDARRDLH